MDMLGTFKNWLNPSQPAAPQYTNYSTLAPVDWQQQVANSAGFNSHASGGGGIPLTMRTDPTFMQSVLGYTDQNGNQQQGWGGLALGAASALGNSYMGMKQYGLAKDALKQQQRQFDINFGAQRQMVNSQLEDRQRARVASNPEAYQSVGEYMNQNRIR